MPLFGPPNASKLKAKSDVPGLIKALDFKKDPLVRRDAALALGELGDGRAVEPLLDLIADPERDVRAGVAGALGTLGDVRVVDPLIARLADEDPGVREAAAGSLGRLGPALAQAGDARPVGPLIEALKDGFLAVRDAAAAALGQMGSLAIEPLLAALKDTDGAVRKGASDGLVGIGEPALEPLVAALSDPELRPSVVPVIGRIGGARTVELLIEALKADTDPVRRAAADTLDLLSWRPDSGQAGAAYWAAKGQWQKCVELGRPAVETLIDALKHPDSLVRQLASSGLGQIRDPRAVEPLIAALKGREDGRAAAASALGDIDDERAVEPLVAALKDAGPHVRAAAARALGRLGDVRAVEKLLAALRDHESDVRAAAAAGLGDIGDVRAVEPLISALRGREDVRADAAMALGQIGDSRAIEPLIEALSDLRLCVAAAQALLLIGAPAAGPLVETLLDRDEVVRNAAAETVMVQVGEPAYGPLVGLLTNDREVVRAAAADVLDKTAWAPNSAEAAATYWAGRNQWAQCVQLGAPAIGPLALAARTWQGTELRIAAIEALGRIGGAGVVEPLVALMKDRVTEVRKAVAVALGQAHDPGAVEPLITALKDRIGTVRTAAEEALAGFRDPRAVEVLGALRPEVVEPEPGVSAEPVAAAVPVAVTAAVPVAASMPGRPTPPAAPSAQGSVPASFAAQAASSAWSPTHVVPPPGAIFWTVPDGRYAPAGQIAAFTDLVVEATNGAWCLVRAENGWRGWVDGRGLVVRR